MGSQKLSSKTKLSVASFNMPPNKMRDIHK